MTYVLDNSGSDSRNLIGQLQVSKRGRNIERDSLSASGGGGGGGGGEDSKCPGLCTYLIAALRDNVLVATYALLLSKLVRH